MFYLGVGDVLPSQLYLNRSKLDGLKYFDPTALTPLPVKKLGNQVFLTDGHHRAYLYWKAGYDKLPLYWDTDDLDIKLYEACLNWCQEAGVTHVKDLEDRLISNEEYQQLWLNRCREWGKR